MAEFSFTAADSSLIVHRSEGLLPLILINDNLNNYLENGVWLKIDRIGRKGSFILSFNLGYYLGVPTYAIGNRE